MRRMLAAVVAATCFILGCKTTDGTESNPDNVSPYSTVTPESDIGWSKK